MRNRFAVVVGSVLLCLLVSCDPEKAIYKLFSDQGINLLKPARNYITVGGIFVLPKKGRKQYIDAQDKIPSTSPADIDFLAVIPAEYKNQSIGIKAAVGTLGGLVAMPAGLQFQHDSQVKLAQINSNGTRYTTNQVQTLLGMDKTIQSIRPRLKEGAAVYVVQEVYTSTSLDVASSSGTGIAASVYGSASIPSCGSGTNSSTSSSNSVTSGGEGNSNSSSSSTDNSSSHNPAAGSATDASKKALASAGSSGSSHNGSSAKSSADNGTLAKSSSDSGTGSDVGVSVGVCLTNNSTLKFTSPTPVPFAVRLIQVEEANDSSKTLNIKYTGFNPPPVALGGDMSAVALVNKQQPVIENFEHVQK